MSETRACDAVVIGAGIAGLCAAEQLVAAGRHVVVLDKARGIGGRMATRRVGAAVCDHGAQFFTVRGADFAGIVSAAPEPVGTRPGTPASSRPPTEGACRITDGMPSAFMASRSARVAFAGT